MTNLLLFLVLLPAFVYLFSLWKHVQLHKAYLWLKICFGFQTGFLLATAFLLVFFNTSISMNIWLPFQEKSISIGFSLDRLSVLMLLLVNLISFAVVAFSQRYLNGEKIQKQFVGHFICAFSAVSLMIASTSLLQFVIIWFFLERFTHKLLLLHPTALMARECVRIKAFFSYFADGLLILACLYCYKYFGTSNFNLLRQLVELNIPIFNADRLNLLACLVALAVLIRTACLPFHSWLPISLGAVTPVSAFMHAGIINAGGYLLIKTSFILQYSVAAGVLLTALGALTAVFAMCVMVTQSSIKKRLAYSTVGQMGFMVMQCGLGFYSLAMLHIIAHASYKAYAFLNSADAISQARDQNFYEQRSSFMPTFTGQLVLIGSFALLIPVFYYANSLFAINYLPLVFIWLIFFLHILLITWRQLSTNGVQTIALGVLMTALMVATYAILSNQLEIFLKSEIAHSWLLLSSDNTKVSLVLLVSLLFLVGFVIQIASSQIFNSQIGKAFWVHLYNGFYFDHLTKRLLNFFRNEEKIYLPVLLRREDVAK